MSKNSKKNQKLNGSNAPTEPSKTEGKGHPNFSKYVGLSFQLFATIALGTYLGWKVQQQSEMKFPVWILTFCFFSVFLAFYHLWITIKRDN